MAGGANDLADAPDGTAAVADAAGAGQPGRSSPGSRVARRGTTTMAPALGANRRTLIGPAAPAGANGRDTPPTEGLRADPHGRGRSAGSWDQPGAPPAHPLRLSPLG